MELEQINNIKIKPVITESSNWGPKTVRAFDYYNEPYSNTALIAGKFSGKTNLIYRALEQCATKGTNVMIFCSTANLDKTYAKMIKMLKKKKANVTTEDHFIVDGVNIIEQLLNHLQNEKDDAENVEVELKPPPLLMFDTKNLKVQQQGNGDVKMMTKPPSKKSKTKVKKDKLLTPEYIFVFDDLSSDMTDKSITRLLTKNRHFKAKTFISIHDVTNLTKGGLRMIDNFHCFPNLSNDRIEELGEKVNIKFKSDTRKRSCLQELYDDATSKPYQFLYIDRGNGTFRKNYDKKYKDTFEQPKVEI